MHAAVMRGDVAVEEATRLRSELEHTLADAQRALADFIARQKARAVGEG
jgi:hypothetical protein